MWYYSFIFTLLLSVSAAQPFTVELPMDGRGRSGMVTYYRFADQAFDLRITSADDIHAASISEAFVASCSGFQIVQSSEPKISLHQHSGTLNTSGQGAALISSAPSLISQGKANAGLSTRRTRHTFLAQDSQQRWIIGYTPAISSEQLAKSLAESSLGITTALIINRGRTAALWIKNSEFQPLYLRPLTPPSTVIGVVKQ